MAHPYNLSHPSRLCSAIFRKWQRAVVTCDEKIKILFSQNVLLWIFLEIRFLIWRYAELNCLLVGSGQIPLNIKLKQDDYTVWCIHSVVNFMASLNKTLWDLEALLALSCSASFIQPNGVSSTHSQKCVFLLKLRTELNLGCGGGG